MVFVKWCFKWFSVFIHINQPSGGRMSHSHIGMIRDSVEKDLLKDFQGRKIAELCRSAVLEIYFPTLLLHLFGGKGT